jgi:hypothetical protein
MASASTPIDFAIETGKAITPLARALIGWTGLI